MPKINRITYIRIGHNVHLKSANNDNILYLLRIINQLPSTLCFHFLGKQTKGALNVVVFKMHSYPMYVACCHHMESTLVRQKQFYLSKKA